MKSRKIGSSGLEVSEIGLGCMGISFGYGSTGDPKKIIELNHKEGKLGVTFFHNAVWRKSLESYRFPIPPNFIVWKRI